MESDLFFPITLTQMQAAWISSLLKRFIPCWSKVQIYLQLIHWRRGRLSAPLFLGFPCGSAGKESACHARDLGSIPRLGRSPGEGKGCPLQYSSLENSMDYTWGLSLGLEWKLTFSSPVATAEFSKFAGILSAALS